MDFEDYSQIVKAGGGKGGGGGGGVKSGDVRAAKKELADQQAEFERRTTAQQTKFDSRITDLQQASKDQISNLEASFGSQLTVAEDARKSIEAQNRDLVARGNQRRVGASATGATPVKSTSAVSVFAGGRSGRGRSSNIQKSSSSSGTTLGSKIAF
jgi:Tfp pilus assembly protein PilE